MTSASGETRSAGSPCATGLSTDPSGGPPIRVCFHRRQAWKLFDPLTTDSFGGAEVRSVLFAKALAARRGFEVSFMVGDEGHPSEAGIRMLPVAPEVSRLDRAALISYSRFQRLSTRSGSWMRYCDPRLIWDVPCLAFHKIVAGYLRRTPQPRGVYRQETIDVFCCFGLDDPEGAALAATCERTGTPLLVFLISDMDVSPYVRPNGPKVPGTNVDGALGWFILQRARHVVVQSEYQRQQVVDRIGGSAVLIRNPIDLRSRIPITDHAAFPDREPSSTRHPANSARGPHAEPCVLWIGRSEPRDLNQKRPDAYWELARRCPSIPFLAVLNNVNTQRFEELVRTRPPNLQVIEHVPHQQIDGVFAQAALLVNTSTSEGFPNTFLQAGMHAIPIISLVVDPDSILRRENWGVVCNDDIDFAARTLADLWRDLPTRRQMGARGRAYVEREHDLSARVEELVRLLELVAGRAKEMPRTEVQRF